MEDDLKRLTVTFRHRLTCLSRTRETCEGLQRLSCPCKEWKQLQLIGDHAGGGAPHLEPTEGVVGSCICKQGKSVYAQGLAYTKGWAELQETDALH